MDTLITMLVLGSSAWVLVDAKTIGVKKGQLQGVASLGAMGWFAVCLLLWVIGFPFYLAKRSELKTINKKEKGAPRAVTIGIAIITIIACAIFTTETQADIENSAIPVVTEIIQQQFASDASCIRVNIEEEPVKNFYLATALLDNGHQLDITIKKQKKGVYINIPLDQ